MSTDDIFLKNNHGGPLYYLGNRFLTLPDKSGHMSPDNAWLNELFSIIKLNHGERKYERCIEPLAGSASWSLAAMEVGLADEYVINDSNRVLIKTLELIKDEPESIKKEYMSFLDQFASSASKKHSFLEIIARYNQAIDEKQKALILPFIINHSWSGILFHDINQNIIYHEGALLDEKNSERYLEKASLSLDLFNQEVDRISALLNANRVVFKSGDFLKIVADIRSNDFIALNPPYPENERSVVDQLGMYTELYAPEMLHEHLRHLIDKMDSEHIDYFMTYGFYNPNLSQFVLTDLKTNKPKNYFRALGYEHCAFGMGLDQMYFPSGFLIPEYLKSKFVPASEVLQDAKLAAEEALSCYNTLNI